MAAPGEEADLDAADSQATVADEALPMAATARAPSEEWELVPDLAAGSRQNALQGGSGRASSVAAAASRSWTPVTSTADAAVEARLEQLGFTGEQVRAATHSLGRKGSLEDTCENLLTSHPSGSAELSREVVADDSAAAVPEPPAKRQASESLKRKLSQASQQVFERVTSRHAGVSRASVVRLLLRAAAALRQGLLDEAQRVQLHQHLEEGDIDLVHSVVLGIGVRSEPGMPLEDGEVSWECCICFTEQEEQGWRCPDSHQYCTGCIRQHAESVPFPRCPTSGCKNELGEKDLELVQVPEARLEAFRAAKLRKAVDSLASGVGGGAAAAGSGGATSSRCGGGGSVGAAAMCEEELIRCPNLTCGNAVLVSRRERRRYACACGAEPFCTRCRQAPHHYHRQCRDLQPLRQRWLEWVSGGRDEFFGKATAAAAYEKQALAIRESMLRHRDLEADEQWKAKRCRMCPACRKPIQKLEGCESMTCGTDAHGGNEQPGCGHSFNFNQAPRYEPKVESRELPKITAEEIRTRGHRTLHAFVDCSLCGSRGILGPRFRCLHCERFDACKDCELKLAELHDPSHVFEVMLESDFAWSGFRLPKGTCVRVVRSGDVLPLDLENLDSTRRLEGRCGVVTRSPGETGPKRKHRGHVPMRYEWQTNRGRWNAYDAPTNAAINEANQRGQLRVNLRIDGTRYLVDLARMRQTNLSTRGSRPVRGTPNAEAAAVADAVAASEAHAEASSAGANPYRVQLDEGGSEVVVTAAHLEPMLESRKEAEELMERALKEQEEGVPEPEVPQPSEGEDEDEVEDEEEYSD